MSYQVSTKKALHNAGRFLQEAGMDAVKLEGGRERLEDIRAIVGAGIPVMGHLGLTPQSIHQIGGFRAQGKTANTGIRMYEDAKLLQDAGCFSLVLEAVPGKLAAFISHHLEIPTIGIGAGAGCDGQVLVTHDLIGLFDRFTPKFVKQYAQIYDEILRAFDTFRKDVESRKFPADEHSISMTDDEWEAFLLGVQD
jgi:3-methyl-2-oxobutanoate hydroxymethyltransferase